MGEPGEVSAITRALDLAGFVKWGFVEFAGDLEDRNTDIRGKFVKENFRDTGGSLDAHVWDWMMVFRFTRREIRPSGSLSSAKVY